MQLQHLIYFVAVAEVRHFTQAADIIGVSQPTLSKQIRALENSLGTRLFDRTGPMIELTTTGEALLPHARRIVIDVQNAKRAVREVANLQRGRIRLGATPSMIDGLLPSVFTEFHREYPDIDLVIHEAGSRVLTDELVAGRLDLALLIVPLTMSIAAHASDLETTTVFRERLVLASPADTAMPPQIAVADLEGLPLVMFREGYDLRDVTLQACQAAGFEPNLVIEGGEMGSVLRFVEAGLGYAVVPDIVLANRAGLRRSRIVDPPLSREIAVAHRSVESLPLAARVFREQLMETLEATLESA